MPDNASAPAQGTAVAKRDTSDVGLFQRQLESRARDIQMALPAHITPEKFQRTILTAVAQNPDLLKADRNSLILATYKSAQDGLLPDGNEAAFVVYSTRKKIDGQWKTVKVVQYTPMVKGLRKKVLQSGEVTDIFASVVFKQEIEAGHFIYEEGTERMLRHKPILDPDFSPSDADIAIAYSVATFKDGSKSFEVMFRRDINKVRQCSQTGATGRIAQYDMGDIKKGQEIPPKGPWVDWFSEQAKKSAIRRHTKTLPMSSDTFVDVEGREIEQGMSAALALGSQAPDEPVAIEDLSDEVAHDPETGEIIEEGANAAAEDTADEPVNKTPETQPQPARGRKAKPVEPDKAKEPEQPAEKAATDELGVTEHPAAAKAEEILGKFAKAETIIDLERVYRENEQDISAMPDDIYDGVMGGYNRNRVRLGGQRVPVEQAEAAE